MTNQLRRKTLNALISLSSLVLQLSPVFEKSRKFNVDKSAKKVNLGVGGLDVDFRKAIA